MTDLPPPAPEGRSATLSIDYPDRELDRLSTGLRIFWAIPILILAAAIAGLSISTGNVNESATVTAAGLLFLPTLLMIVFRQRYPAWWYEWNLQMLRFLMRINAYLALMDDRYPSTTDEQSVHLTLPPVDAERDLNRWLPLVKWFLAIPHFIVLFFLQVGAFFVVIFSWFAILFTGRYPRGAFDYVEGVARWETRVVAYAIVLVTDEYPPFRLAP